MKKGAARSFVRAMVMTAVAVGLLEGAIITSVARGRAQRGIAAWELVDVAAAAVDLEPGAVLKREDLTVRIWPKLFAPAGIVRSDAKAHLVGKTLQLKVRAGDPFREQWLDAPQQATRCYEEALGAARVLGVESDEAVKGALTALELRARSSRSGP